MCVEPLKYIRRIECLEVRAFLNHQECLDDFMLGDLSGAESTKLICDVSELIKHELDILIVVSLEVVEEIAKKINT